ncbi:hypothetical protein [Vogesella sp. LIG4]|uniref:hypothetical protein n=1 Tax=Vogesella sp. LIG4 TaxID=1192162 RepID=UPI001E446A41|nr:hypothetical protein [Vogesella sp. LIG4]
MLLLFTDISGISHLLQKLGVVAATGWIYMTPVVALLIGGAAGEQVGLLEILAVIVIFGSIAMLEAGRRQLARRESDWFRMSRRSHTPGARCSERAAIAC